MGLMTILNEGFDARDLPLLEAAGQIKNEIN
jgi:hypothetical protein